MDFRLAAASKAIMFVRSVASRSDRVVIAKRIIAFQTAPNAMSARRKAINSISTDFFFRFCRGLRLRHQLPYLY